MAKRKKASIFGEDDGAQVDDEFMKYVQEKSALSKKRMKEDAAGTRNLTKELVDQTDPIDTSVTKSGSRYMDRLLASKKQRELDKLHAQSIKARLEKRLEGGSGEEIVTEGYMQKKDSYEKADQLAEREHGSELEEKHASVLNASGVALKILTSEREPGDSTPPSSFVMEDNFKRAKINYKNDLYINKANRQTTQVEAQDDLDPEKKRVLVAEFLKSNRSKDYIELLTKQYWERQNGH